MTILLELEMPENQVTVYYDYTCPYSYRAARWLRQLGEAGRKLEVEWKTFSLKEVNRGVGEPSVLDRQRAESVSVLALEPTKAAQVAGPGLFERYHYRVFEAMHDDGRKLEASDLLTIARYAGLDTGRFEVERREGVWLRRVAEDHREGAERWKVFGTPTQAHLRS